MRYFVSSMAKSVPISLACRSAFSPATEMGFMGTRGVIGDKWSSRILWACAIGSAVGLYMVVVERQLQNRERAMADGFNSLDTKGRGDNV